MVLLKALFPIDAPPSHTPLTIHVAANLPWVLADFTNAPIGDGRSTRSGGASWRGSDSTVTARSSGQPAQVAEPKRAEPSSPAQVKQLAPPPYFEVVSGSGTARVCNHACEGVKCNSLSARRQCNTIQPGEIITRYLKTKHVCVMPPLWSKCNSPAARQGDVFTPCVHRLAPSPG